MNDFLLHELAKIRSADIQRELEHKRFINIASEDSTLPMKRGIPFFRRNKRNNGIK